MNESIPLPNQQEKQGNKFGPWFHRILFILTLIITIYMQNQIQSLFEEINIMDETLRIIIQLFLIIILWGFTHKLLNFN